MVGRFRKNDDDKRPDPPKRSSSRPPKDDDKDQGRRLPFGGRGKPDDEKPSGSSRFPLPSRNEPDDKSSGRRSPFGGRSDDRDKADDKSSGRRLPFGGRGDDQADESSGRRSPFGGRSDDRDKADDKSSGRRSPFGGRGDDKDKPAQPKGLLPKTPDRSSSSTRRGDDKKEDDKGRFGRFMPGRKDKEDDKPEPQRSPFLRGADDAPGSRTPSKSPTSSKPPTSGGPFGERRPAAPGPGDRKPSSFGRTGQDEDRPGAGGGSRPSSFGGDRPGGFSRSSPGDRDESPSRSSTFGGDRPGSFSKPTQGDRPGTFGGDRPGTFSRSSPGDRDESPSRGTFGGDRPGGFSRSTPGDRDESPSRGTFGSDRPGSSLGNRSMSRTPIGAGDDDDDEDDAPARPAFGSRGIGDRPDADNPSRSASRPGQFGTPRSPSQSGGTLGTRPTTSGDRPGSPSGGTFGTRSTPTGDRPGSPSGGTFGTRPTSTGDRPGGFSRPGAPPTKPDESKKDEGRKSRLPSLIPGRGSKPAESEKPAGPSRSSGFGKDAPGKSPIPQRSASAAVQAPSRPGSQPALSPAKPAPKGKPDKKAAPPKKADKTPAPTRSRTQAAPLPQKKNAPQLVGGGLDLDRKLDLIGVALVMLGGIMFFGVIPSMSFGLLPPVEGGLTGTIDNALSTLFGWGKIVWPMLFFAIGLWLMLRYFGGRMFDVPYFRVVGALILYACILTWIHMLQLVNDPAPTVEAFRPISESLALDQGQGGGYVGHKAYFLLISQLGDWGTLVCLIGWLVLGLMLTFDVSVVEIGQFIGSIFLAAGLGRGDRALKRAAKEAATAEAVPVLRPGETPPVPPTKQMPLAPPAKATVTAAALPTAALAIAGQEKPAVEEGRSTPFIRRRGNGETTETVDPSAPPVRPGTTPPVPADPVSEKVDDETRTPERRRLPHLRRAGPETPAGETAADKKPEPIPASDENAHSGGRLGFLRRNKGAAPEAGEKPAVGTTPEASGVNKDENAAPSGERSGFLRRSTPPTEEKPAAVTTPEPAPTVPDESAQSSGRLGFLRRSTPTPAEKPTETSQEAATPTGLPASRSPFARAEADKPETSDAAPDADHAEPAPPAAAERTDLPPGPRRMLEPPARNLEPSRPDIPARPSADLPARPSGVVPARSSPFARSVPGSLRPASEETPSYEDSAEEKPAERPMAPPMRDRAQALGIPQRTPPARPAFSRPGESKAEEDKPADPIVDKAEDKSDLQAGEQVESKPVEPVEVAAASAESTPSPARPAADPPARSGFNFGLPRSSAPSPEPGKQPAEPQLEAAPKVEVAPEPVEEKAEVKTVPDEKPAVPKGILPRAMPPARFGTAKLGKDDDEIDEDLDDDIDFDDEDDDFDDEEPMVKAEAPARPSVVPSRTIPPMRPAPPPPQQAQITTPPPARRDEPPRPSVRPPTNVPLGKSAPEPAAAVAQGANAPQAKATPPTGGGYELPDFHKILRQGGEQHINDEILLDKARIIEDTLASFGAPGKVVEVNPGPVITQFGVEPDYLLGRGGKKMRVKVGSIARLDADLALALAAKSIRIEAPVPGKGFVGIEVPNDETTLVGLYDIMDSPQFNRMDSKLRLALGLSVDGTPVAADLAAMPHLLIAGTTGSGKSVCVNSIIACLLLSNTPEDVQFIMVDPKRVELTGYNGIPHLVAPVVVELERIVGVLQWVQREMEERYRKFAAIGARNILDYNGKLSPGERKMPYYVVIVDELADLMMLAPDETERLLARLAQMARATGIHLIISTQRPSVDIITGLIKANFPARIAFAVASSVDSRVILDQPGAEKLLGRGDMLFQSPDAAAPVRMQGVFLSDEEINRITRYWKGLMLEDAGTEGHATLASPSRSITFNATPASPTGNRPSIASPKSTADPAQRAFWDDSGSVTLSNGDSDGEGTGEDELYDEAVDLVMRLNKASISLLQRRLRIGYTRAARLIDIMEQDGIVGPAESGSKPREVLKTKRD